MENTMTIGEWQAYDAIGQNTLNQSLIDLRIKLEAMRVARQRLLDQSAKTTKAINDYLNKLK